MEYALVAGSGWFRVLVAGGRVRFLRTQQCVKSQCMIDLLRLADFLPCGWGLADGSFGWHRRCASLFGGVCRGGVCRDGSLVLVGEFDPGSGRTLAACLTHASRAERPLRGYSSGERVSNT